MTIFCIGKNYSEHIREMGGKPDSSPVFFIKPETSLLLNNSPFPYPSFSNQIHYEIELVLRISSKAAIVKPEDAFRYFDGIGLGIDFTARDQQQKAKVEGNPWTLAKGFDHSAPISDFLPLSPEIDFQNINFHLNINNSCRQKGNSSTMIFSFEKIISYISEYITLRPGDIIFTGTPQGVGPVFKGDRLEGFIGEKKLLDFLIS
ncbi:MAG: 2-hydroxyhepta-2,4-diene-1,7-dioate isomerase [Bacteroidetes bacterium RIFCSPLOWO2_02_FULL_36_8]|nr:MAG: 2-hydroxyhepta-2,4-diene-1,7-dioate isomerase [Bacteroidetes bacterium RIFCSPLOWO2_02_FULL_36_8]OFY72014.1 MAG: 2-hydroxyhepta-2,4-diene-1,7-dioate isomerase [Bacteroidetes bacterium RIFCSPLOWO2_12_FULL_37_12]